MSSRHDDPILIVGAGIAGLTAALSLAASGRDVRIFEAADPIREVGAGIQLSPNASRIFTALGLAPAIEAEAVHPQALKIFNGATGHSIVSMPLGPSFEHRYGAPYWVIHRGQLQAVLLQAIEDDTRIELMTGHRLQDVEQTPDQVEARIAHDGEILEVTAPILIAADGVWSTVRSAGLGLPPAVYSGRSAWRARIPADSVPPDFAGWTGLWLNARSHLVHYPISAGREINVVAVIEDEWREVGWNAPGDPAHLARRFADWAAPARDLIDRADTWLKWALCGVDPGPDWVRGRVALIGDAAHAMLPFLAQGGAMATEDAAILAVCVAGAPDNPARALAAYQTNRRRRVERVVAHARRNGHVYHLSGPAALARDLAMKAMGGAGMHRRYDWLYGWRPEPHAA